MDMSRYYNITVKVIMDVIYLTGHCTGLGELQTGPICAAIGRGSLQFPRESGRSFICRRTAGRWRSITGDLPLFSKYFCGHPRKNPACRRWLKPPTVLQPSHLGYSSWRRGEWDLGTWKAIKSYSWLFLWSRNDSPIVKHFLIRTFVEIIATFIFF